MGEKYEATRHNIGFMVVDEIARKKNLTFSSGHKVQVAKFQANGKTVYLLKPNTFMNLSGDAVSHWFKQTGSEIDEVLVITDDLSLPFGSIRIRAKGSAGGHNGLTDIEEKLKRQDYARMRMGIGSDFEKGQQVSYVLGRFPAEDAGKLKAVLDKSAEAVMCFISRGLSQAMNQYNG